MRVEEPWMLRHEAISGEQKVRGGGLRKAGRGQQQ